MEIKLDCTGLQCPQPVMRCREALQTHPDKLAVTVDNMAAVENVSRFLTQNGFVTTTTQLGQGSWRVEALKKSDSASVKAAPQIQPGETGGKTLVFITTETLGRGDDTLGAKLMGTFIATLPELGASLWRIILLNGGVKLACEGSTAVDSLKKLESSGVSILVCGTCLMHYGLAEKKQVGETTNMLDVITSLGLAQKVIRP